MRVIAVVNQKGGCGKTTVSINLANAIAELGHRTLLVDMDPQSHCAVGLAVPEEQIEQSIYDVLISKSRNEPLKLTEILWQISDKLELAPSNIDLSAFEQQMIGVSDRENCLKSVLHEVRNEFDYVIVDCPPAVGLLTFNALRSSTDVIVPVETGYFALHGLSKQLETLSILCQRFNQKIGVRVLASMYDIRTKMAREVLSELKEHFGGKMFATTVNFNTKIKEAASFGQPIGEYDPTSKGQLDFKMLAEEVIGARKKEEQRTLVNSLAAQLDSISSSADELLKKTRPAVAVMEQPNEKIQEVKRIVKQEIKTIQPEPRPQSTPQVQPSFSQTAVEVKQEVKPKVESVQPAAQQKAFSEMMDQKLSDYYGVNKVGDAVAFVTLYPRASSVHIAGDFNNWQPTSTPMHKVGDGGVWQTKVKLPSGKHRYRLVVDGLWQQDPYNEMAEQNPFGGMNSVVEVV
jgi:chromosome partitioning protein